MKHIKLPDSRERRLIFYLAMEEFVARELDEDEAFFIWQVAPTVIFGRNQLMEAEVNMPYCKEHGIQTYRRKSGGGCVYSDKGNLMLSYITKGDSVGFYFDRYIRRVAFMLQKKGVNAQVAGRNDILIDGKKVSGNAFYKIPGKCIIHGTLLFDTDFDSLQQAITPSDNKLKSKGVASVRQHVTNLSEHLDMDIENFKQYLIDDMCRGEERTLTADEIARIEQIEQTYLEESFLRGCNPAYTVCKTDKIEAVGEVMANLEVRNGRIRRLSLTGDFFPLYDTDVELNRRLHNVTLEREALQAALRDFNLENYIMNFKTNNFIDLLLKS